VSGYRSDTASPTAKSPTDPHQTRNPNVS
jgi:hypothetical protein